ncbi:MAG: alkaline phosphatase family protein [Gemmataceae bacterium]
MKPIILLNAVGLTNRLLPFAPRLSALALSGWSASMPDVLPSVTCTAQATILTGTMPNQHGIVANGWLFRETNEVRFWQQSNSLMQAEPVYATARKRASERGLPFSSAKLFWWFNQGAAVDISVTPKPWYGVDGNKAFDVTGTPLGYSEELTRKLGAFPFPSFWGPNAGLPCTQWIAQCAAAVIREKSPTLSLVYLPHLDYEPQRHGPAGCDMSRYVRELDDACEPIFDAAKEIGADIWVVSEYGHCNVSRAVEPNRALRRAGLLRVRKGPFGEQLDVYESLAFAVCDHQLAHVYVRDPHDIPVVREILESLPGVAKLYAGEERAAIHLDHERSGELILLAQSDAWFAYPFWLDDAVAPDYARAVAIHNKPGFDPCELFFDPKLAFPRLRAARRLLQKKLGFRTIFDVIPLDASIVRGSHGRAASDPLDAPILIGHGPSPGPSVSMTSVKEMVLSKWNLNE